MFVVNVGESGGAAAAARFCSFRIEAYQQGYRAIVSDYGIPPHLNISWYIVASIWAKWIRHIRYMPSPTLSGPL